MEENLILVESKEKREELISHLEVLDKVKSLAFLTKDLVVTVEQVANYFEVENETIKKLVTRNKEELQSNGLTTLKGQELKDFKEEISKGQDVPSLKRVSHLTLFTKRTVLNVGMLLTESEVAEKVRDYLLNVEEKAPEELKAEAVNETIEKVAEQLDIKLLKTEAREAAKLVKIQAAKDTLSTYGLTETQANFVIQKAIVDKVNIDKAILAEIKKRSDREIEVLRGIVREKVSYAATHYFDNDFSEVYHLLSDKMRYEIGINMRYERSKLKKKNDSAKRGEKVEVTSYLDFIVSYEAYEKADKAIKEIMDEQEAFKELAKQSRKETVKAKNTVKKKEDIKPKEAVQTNFIF